MAWGYTRRLLDCYLTSDAAFRAWGSGMAGAIQALGWVYVADTGRIDWASVTRPGTTNTKAGFEIYRAADVLQATAPFYVRIDYGTSGGVQRPGLWLQFGSGTDGSGNLTSPSSLVQIDMNSAPTTPFEWIFVGGGDQGALGIVGGSKNGMTTVVTSFMLERTHYKGVQDARGAVVVYHSGTSTYTSTKIIPLAWGGAAIASSTAPCMATTATSVQKAGHWTTGAIAHEVFYNLGNCFLVGPIHNAFLIDPAAAPIGTAIRLERDGQIHDYYLTEGLVWRPSQEGGIVYGYNLAVRIT